MTNPSDALGGKSLYEKYGADYQDVIDADRRCSAKPTNPLKPKTPGTALWGRPLLV